MTQDQEISQNYIMDKNQRAEVEYRLARAWQMREHFERAIAGYLKAISIQPEFSQPYIKLGDIYAAQGRFSEAYEILHRGLEFHPNEAKLHKGNVNALVAQSGLESAFRDYQLERVDDKRLEVQPDEVLCCSVIRNETLRLPFFLSYYRQRGITRFLIVDNDSSDGSSSMLVEQPDVYLWRSPFSFNRANFGSGWFELILRRHAINRWCLIVDIDELFYYPECEDKSIPQLCRELDRSNKKGMNAVLLDMYSDRPVKDTHYSRGQDYRDICPFFDRNFYHSLQEEAGPFANQTVYLGGARQRIFGERGSWYQSKVPLIKYNLSFILAGGQHWTNRPPLEIASQSGCLLHFKYFSTFVEDVFEEVERKEHFGAAEQYSIYARALSQNKVLTFYNADCSIRLKDSEQLVKLGIMRAYKRGNGHKNENPAFEFPEIPPVPADAQRTFWSVMIPVYDRVDYLERSLRSVLNQASGSEEMQVEVINDGGVPAEIQDRIEETVATIGEGHAHCFRSPHNLGHPHIFNLCIQRSRGVWVHILPDDDWVEPGFYSALREGIRTDPQIGAAFCRHIQKGEAGALKWISRLERDSAGLVGGWLPRIATSCRLQFSSIAVRRSVYEELGGFCPQADSAFDWEMWVRIAMRYPFWYEPQVLAGFYLGPASASYQLIKNGGQVRDAMAAIEIMSSYLPEESVDALTNAAKEFRAHQAFNIAQEQMKRGDYRAAVANIRAGLNCSQSSSVVQHLINYLNSVKDPH